MPPYPANANERALSQQSQLNDWRKWIDRLACPACHGTLRAEADTILCTACARRYPILNGIPVLIAERAIVNPG